MQLSNSPISVDEKPVRKIHPIFNLKEHAALLRAKREDELMKKTLSGKVTRKRTKTKTLEKVNLKKVKRKLPFLNAEQQYAIDAGQRDFDAQRCKVCNMLYTKGEEQDEYHHQKYHDMFVNSLRFNGWKSQNVVTYYDNGSRIIMVKPSDPKFMLKKVDDLFSIADLELGINSSIFENLRSDQIFLIYLTENRRIAGFVAGERIYYAYEFIAKNGMAITETKIPARIGISRLWVHNCYRRNNIATRLVDALRSCVDKEKIIDKGMIAFMDPTPQGTEFASKYTQRGNILVYDLSSNEDQSGASDNQEQIISHT